MLFISITEFLDLLLPFEPKESALPCESGGGRGRGGPGQGAGRTRELLKHPRCLINKEKPEKGLQS